MQLVEVSLVKYLGKEICVLKQMIGIHIVQRCHSHEMCIQDNIIDILGTLSWDRPLLFPWIILDK